MADSLQLPTPDTDAQAHSQRLVQVIVEEIQRRGPISFDQFWELAMYAPGLGYYSAGARKFGAGGDFVTAPELGNVFASCLAKPIEQALDQLGASTIMEVGAGSGILAHDLLTTLDQRLDSPPQYRILERSADLRQRQQQCLASFGDRVQWLDEPSNEPWQGVLIGNEVLDALAAKRVIKSSAGWRELAVGVVDNHLEWITATLDEANHDRLVELEAEVTVLPDGYRTELQPSIGPWVAAVTESLQSGLVLLADYGYPRSEYYLPDRNDGSLICHYRHRAHYDPFLWPGLNDLSVSVDFTAVAEALDAGGFDVCGFTTQAQFLLDSGLPEILSDTATVPEAQQAALLAQIKTLTLPAEMGEHIKIIAGTRGQIDIDGFAFNQLGRL